MKKITLLSIMIAGIAFAAFKNSGNPAVPGLMPENKIAMPIGTQLTYEVDIEKSTVGWHAKKATGQHYGTVKIAKGEIFRNKGLLNGGEFELDMTSVADTDITDPVYRAKLDGHLKSETFFDVTKFPKATFKIKIWAPITNQKPDAPNYYVKGDLTIKGITKEISFPALLNLGDSLITADAELKIDRTDFGIKYQSIKFDAGIGDKMINDEFELKVHLVANRNKK